MLSKEEVKSIAILEAKMQKENEEKQTVKCITKNMDEVTICTVDEEDMKDNGSSCVEDDHMLGFEDDAWAAAPIIADSDSIPSIFPHGISGSENDDKDYIVDAEISPPSKRARLLSDQQEELEVLKLKYKELLVKSQNFHMTAAHWKKHYNQTVQLQVPMTDATQDNMVNQVMNNIVYSKHMFISLNRIHLPPITSSGNI